MRFGMSELKSDNFYQNSMKNLRGGISQQPLGKRLFGDGGPSAAEGGLSSGAKIVGLPCFSLDLIRPQVWQESPLKE